MLSPVVVLVIVTIVVSVVPLAVGLIVIPMPGNKRPLVFNSAFFHFPTKESITLCKH